MQGHSRVATANSSYAKAKDAYDELNSVNDQRFPCSGFVYSCTFWDEFRENNSI